MVQLKDILKEKRRGKVIKGVLFLDDNVPSHRALATQKKLAYLGFQCLNRHFSCDAEVIAAAETWLDGQPSDFFLSGLQKVRATS